MIERDYRDYLQDMIDSIGDIENFTAGLDFEAFSQDRKTSNAVTRSVEVIGEAAKKIPDRTRKQYPVIPWKKMAGMRDKLIHEYFGIDLEILWKVAKEDLPPLKAPISKILEDLSK
jgi:uncharacterized protein with HEPN domain